MTTNRKNLTAEERNQLRLKFLGLLEWGQVGHNAILTCYMKEQEWGPVPQQPIPTQDKPTIQSPKLATNAFPAKSKDEPEKDTDWESPKERARYEYGF